MASDKDNDAGLVEEAAEEAVHLSVGARLKQAREARELGIAQAAVSMRVDTRVLQGLEDDRFEVLGAAVFVRGHLRKYAKLLGLPEQEILAAYEAEAGQTGEAALVPINRDGLVVSRRRKRFRPGRALIVILVLALLSAGGWYGYRLFLADGLTLPGSRGESVPVQLPASGDSLPLDLPAQAGGEEPSDEVLAQAGEETLPGENAVAEEPPAASQPVPTVNNVAPAVAAATGPVVSLGLEFVEDSWAEVHDASRKRVLYGLFRAGTSRSFELAAPVSVYLGQVDGVRVTVNGDPYRVPENLRRGDTARFTIEKP